MSTEDAYRRHSLREDAVRGAIAMAIVSVAQLLFVWNDWVLFGWEPPFVPLLIVRGVTCVAGLALAALQLRSQSPRAHDQRLAIWCAMLAICLVYAVSTRPADFIGHGAPTAVLAMALYAIFPGPLAPRAIAALVISVSTFVFSMSSVTSIAGRNALLLTHVAVHAVGILNDLRMAALRRRTFATQAALEQKARALEAETARVHELARVKTSFLATVSHELRTPMNAVLGLSELLTRGTLATEERAQARAIHDSAQGLLVVLNDILDMAKIEAGRMTVSRAPFEIRALVRSLERLFRASAEARRIGLTMTVERDVPAGALGDAARLTQILTNLVSNAIKFTDKGSVDVRVRACDVTANGFVLAVDVEDTGPGIADELRERLFHPFEQGTETTSGGTGLGLAISRRLAEAMGGALRLASPPGHGARFELTLPTVAAELATPSADVDATDLPPRPLRILVADDNAINRRVATAMLAHLGYAADTVDDGAAAVAAVARKPYDLVFLDLRMPGMDGLAAARAICAHPPCPRLIALTASVFAEDRATCLAAGMDDVITKPMQLDDLRRALAATHTRILAVDRSFIAKLRELESASNASGLVADLCARFLADTPRLLAAMTTAVDLADASAVEQEAHSLKSSAAFLGAVRFSRICGEIEEAARGGTVERCASYVAELNGELPHVRDALVAELASHDVA